MIHGRVDDSSGHETEVDGSGLRVRSVRRPVDPRGKVKDNGFLPI